MTDKTTRAQKRQHQRKMVKAGYVHVAGWCMPDDVSAARYTQAATALRKAINATGEGKYAMAVLLDKVRTGTAIETDFAESWPHATQLEHSNAWLAYIGSLDGAKRLHDAVLPCMSQYSIVTDPTCLCVKVCWWPDGLSVGTEVCGEGWSEDDPARAWLLAILSALIAMEDLG